MFICMQQWRLAENSLGGADVMMSAGFSIRIQMNSQQTTTAIQQ